MSATNASRNGCEAEAAEVPVAAPEVEADKPARSRSALARNEELARAEKMRREFSANVSHEMKTPLQVISGYAELMANGLVPPEDVPRFAQLIYEESQAMRALIDDVLILSRLDEMAPGDNETDGHDRGGAGTLQHRRGQCTGQNTEEGVLRHGGQNGTHAFASRLLQVVAHEVHAVQEQSQTAEQSQPDLQQFFHLCVSFLRRPAPCEPRSSAGRALAARARLSREGV